MILCTDELILLQRLTFILCYAYPKVCKLVNLSRFRIILNTLQAHFVDKIKRKNMHNNVKKNKVTITTIQLPIF